MRRLLIFEFTAAVVLAALVVGGSSAALTSLTVRSTLDGKTILPHRIHWLGLPSVPAAKVLEVDFMIDGEKAWVERRAPYTYSDDRGYLVTSWLTPGRHEFTTRVIARDGRRAEDTVVARVIPPPAPPTSLAGKWQRDADTSAVPASDLTPSGVYTLTFEKRWIQSRFPGRFAPGHGPGSSAHTGHGWLLDSDWTPGSNRFHVQGAVVFRLLHPEDQEGGSFCGLWGPGADYRWSVTGNNLTLTPVGNDPCRDRAVVWAGVWKRLR